MKYLVAYCSEHGKHKPACEDSALIGDLVINDEAGSAELSAPCWVCLCDGVGGVAGGREASLFVTKELSGGNAPESADDVKRRFVEINNKLLEAAGKTEGHKQMATTATALFLSDWAIYLAHAGNTRLYAKEGAAVRQVTVDQTAHQWFWDHHLRFLANERNRDAIYCGMGGGNAKRMRALVAEQLPDDLLGQTLLLTSDGAHEHLSTAEIAEILNRDISLADQAKMLCSTALEHGSDDDRTVVIIKRQ